VRRLLAFLVALGALSWIGAAAQDAAPPAVSAAAPAGVGVVPGLVLPRLEDLAETRQRPLFSPTRRPPPPPPPPPPAVVAEAPVAEAAEPEPETPPPFVLAGVVTGSTLTLAMLQNRDTAEVARVRRGEEVLGWTVTEVGTTHVVVQRDGRSVRLALFEKKEEPAAAATTGKTGRKKAADDDEEDDDDDE
jgi:general secretion pathway protein N